MDLNSILHTIQESYIGYWNYLKNEILFSYQYKPWYENYFYGLVFLSLFTWSLEILFPWRKNQALFRKDFWLDLFYVFFNFFLFSLVLYNALSNVGVALWNQILQAFGLTNMVAIQLYEFPKWVQYVIIFIIADFIQWNVHRMLHRVPWMWKFHKVHHIGDDRC
jgi:sterol desaturase/sphingolipid hydroxylase (fatty acid hydroxylase superfamily)